MRVALWGPVAGFAGWAASFMGVYALHGVGCAGGWQDVPLGPTNLQRVVQAGSAAACLLVMAVLAVWLHRRLAPAFVHAGDRVLATLTRTSAWAGLAGTAVTLPPVFATSVCR